MNTLKIDYENTLGNYSDLENNTSELSSVNLNEIENLNKKIDNLNKEVKKYKIDIDKLNTEIQNSISSDQFQEIKIENSILKNEIKLLKMKDIENNKKLNQLDELLKEKEVEIEKLIYLKDQQHHG